MGGLGAIEMQAAASGKNASAAYLSAFSDGLSYALAILNGDEADVAACSERLETKLRCDGITYAPEPLGSP